jgi:hypothetical protein
MKGHKWKLIIAVLLIAFASYRAIEWRRWHGHADSSTDVVLELTPATQVIKVGQIPKFALSLINNDDESVVLVEPGDGSVSGWRTPIIEWPAAFLHRGSRCGNINALKPNEVFILKPGETRQLSEWVGHPQLPGPGRYQVTVRYTNRPEHEWGGLPLGTHDAWAMDRVRNSTKVSATSNAVEIIVEK